MVRQRKRVVTSSPLSNACRVSSSGFSSDSKNAEWYGIHPARPTFCYRKVKLKHGTTKARPTCSFAPNRDLVLIEEFSESKCRVEGLFRVPSVQICRFHPCRVYPQRITSKSASVAATCFETAFRQNSCNNESPTEVLNVASEIKD